MRSPRSPTRRRCSPSGRRWPHRRWRSSLAPAPLPGVRPGAAGAARGGVDPRDAASATSPSPSRTCATRRVGGRSTRACRCSCGCCATACCSPPPRRRGSARTVADVDPAVRDPAAPTAERLANDARRGVAGRAAPRRRPGPARRSTRPTRAPSPSSASSSTCARRCASLAGYDDDAAARRSAVPRRRRGERHVEPPLRPVGHRRWRPAACAGWPPTTCRDGSARTAGSTTSTRPPTRRRRPRAGFLHAPGNAQALAAAVLRDHAIDDDDDRWQIQVRSDLARLAARLGNDVRIGVHLSEALGREIERRAGDPAARARAAPPLPGPPGVEGAAGVRRPARARRHAGRRCPPGSARSTTCARSSTPTATCSSPTPCTTSSPAAPRRRRSRWRRPPGSARRPSCALLRTRREGRSVRTTVLVALPPGGRRRGRRR